MGTRGGAYYADSFCCLCLNVKSVRRLFCYCTPVALQHLPESIGGCRLLRDPCRKREDCDRVRFFLFGNRGEGLPFVGPVGKSKLSILEGVVGGY